MTGGPVCSTDAALALVGLGPLMAVSSGVPDVGVGLVDGPVDVDHPDLADANVRAVGGGEFACARPDSDACVHGTFVAGILVARRGSAAPAVCPGATLLVRPVFRELSATGEAPAATPDCVGAAILDCVEAGARVVNLSAATGAPTIRAEQGLRDALDHAARRGILVVAAAGNQGSLGSSEITRHPGVIPVVAYDRAGRPMGQSNLGRTVGRHGLGACGDRIVSVSSGGPGSARTGSSFAAAFVTGAIALLWSLSPTADAATIRHALIGEPRRTTVVPPLLDARAAYERLAVAGR